MPGQRLVETGFDRTVRRQPGYYPTALKKLATEGLVRQVAHRGAYVRSLSTVDMTDLMLVLQYLEPLVYRLVAERIDEGSNRRKFKSAIDAVLSCEGHCQRRFLTARRPASAARNAGRYRRLFRAEADHAASTHMYMFSAQIHQASLKARTSRIRSPISRSWARRFWPATPRRRNGSCGGACVMASRLWPSCRTLMRRSPARYPPGLFRLRFPVRRPHVCGQCTEPVEAA